MKIATKFYLFMLFVSIAPLSLCGMGTACLAKPTPEELNAWARQSLIGHVINGSVHSEKGSVKMQNLHNPESPSVRPQTYITFGDYYFMQNYPERGCIRYGVRHALTLEEAREQLSLLFTRQLKDPLLRERFAFLKSVASANIAYFRKLAELLPTTDPFGNNFAATARFNTTARGAAILAGDTDALLHFSESLDQNPSFAAYFKQHEQMVLALQQRAIARLH